MIPPGESESFLLQKNGYSNRRDINSNRANKGHRNMSGNANVSRQKLLTFNYTVILCQFEKC